MSFRQEPESYTKTAWSDCQGAWENLRESIVKHHPFAESHRLLFHVEEGMSWDSVRNPEQMRFALTLVENVARQAEVPHEVAENIALVRDSFQELLDAIEEGEIERPVEPTRRNKVGALDITVGKPVELIVLACKSNALRCRLLGAAREVTLRTAVRDEIPGAIITVTPKKEWTHARHPYISGDVSAVRFDASVLGLVPLALHDEGQWEPAGDGRGEPLMMFQMEPLILSEHLDGLVSDPIAEARELQASGDHASAQELLTKVVAQDLRSLEAHASLGDLEFKHWPTLALRHYELGVAIGSLTIGDDFDGVLPWELLGNRPFLRCVHGMGLSLWRLGKHGPAAEVLRRLVRLDPADHFGVGVNIAAIEEGAAWPRTRGSEGALHAPET